MSAQASRIASASPVARDLFFAGTRSCRAARFEEAITHFQAAMRLAPGAAELHQWLISAMLAWAGQRKLPAPVKPPSDIVDLPLISVIICSITPAKLARITANLETLVPKASLEIIHISDARSMGDGYNLGARQANGDILIFCHDDIELLTADFASKIVARLENFDLLGVAGSRWLRDAMWVSAGLPYTRGQVVHLLDDRPGATYSAFGSGSPVQGDMQALDGLFLATRREVWSDIGFDEGYRGFHMYDIDFSFRCYLAGRRVAVCNDILIAHYSLGKFGEAWKTEADRFTAKFSERLETRKPGVLSCSNFRLNDMRQVERLFDAFQTFGYCADIAL